MIADVFEEAFFKEFAHGWQKADWSVVLWARVVFTGLGYRNNLGSFPVVWNIGGVYALTKNII